MYFFFSSYINFTVRFILCPLLFLQLLASCCDTPGGHNQTGEAGEFGRAFPASLEPGNFQLSGVHNPRTAFSLWGCGGGEA